jgi:hypothetical protein
MIIVPPGSGIVHQVNLERLARVVFNKDGLLYPDSLVGTDSHTTMINGLGIVGWGIIHLIKLKYFDLILLHKLAISIFKASEELRLKQSCLDKQLAWFCLK